MRYCTECGESLETLREEDDGLCAECMSYHVGRIDYDEDDEADMCQQQMLDEGER